jgi:hypothetical protein
VQEQRSAIRVFLVADVSRSMDFQGVYPKLAVIADFIQALAISAYRSGDALAVVSAEAQLRPELCLPLARSPGPAFRLAARMRSAHAGGSGCRGLIRAVREVVGPRSLVFLLSDFHLPLSSVREILAGLARHDVVPVILWDAAEEFPRQRGIARLEDLESGTRQLLVLRPALVARISENFQRRRESLVALFRKCGREPLLLNAGFAADRVTQYFLGRP